MNEDMWVVMIEQLKSSYPTVAKNIIDYYPSGQFELCVKLKDGTKILYYYLTDSYKILYSSKDESCEEDIDEELYKEYFSKNLSKKMIDLGYGQNMLSDITGISKCSLSNYITGKTLPNIYNLSKLAKALRCSPSELLYFKK